MDMTEEIISRGERTHQAILDAAFSLFISQGYAATSMRQVAHKTNLALGGIYNHFGSKEDVFEALIMERHPYHQVLPALKEATGATAEEFIHNAAHSLVDELERHPELFNLLLIEIVEFKGKHIPKIFEQVYPDASVIAQRLREYGDSVRPLPLPMLVRSFLATFFAYYLSKIILRDVHLPEMQRETRTNVDKLALDTFTDIYLHGILKSTE